MRRTITRSVILGICILFVISMIFALFLRSKQPQYKGEKELAGLSQDTEVLFDKWAIPHIYAQNEEDAYRALGYLHATDRLFQMEMMRRLAKGELAEILGPDLLKYDELFRTLGIREISERLAKKHSKGTAGVKALEAYLEGVNAFIKNGPRPIEFNILSIPSRPFDATDSFAISAYMAYSFINGMKTDPLITYIDEQLSPEYKVDLLPKKSTQLSKKGLNAKDRLGNAETPEEIIKEVTKYAHSLMKDFLPEFEGSNAWVLSGKKTRSGKTMLANDPHIGYSSPSVWYEASMEYPGFKLYGHYLAGVPIAMLGHSEHHGWGVTMLQNKDIDFYKEKVNPENPNQVWFRDHWENLSIRKEEIRVQDKNTPFGAVVQLDVQSTRHGPIINKVIDGFKEVKEPISIRWEFANDENGIFEAFYELAHAETLKEAEQAVSKIYAPGLNVVYANTEGDIAWWAAAHFPIRPDHIQNKFLLDGSSGEDEYQGFHPFSSHPMSVNPDEGFIATANQNPFRNHPYEVPGYYNPDFRYEAIVKVLSEKESDWSVEDIKALQLKTGNQSYKRILDKVLPVLENEEVHKNELSAAAYTLLKEWDLQHSIEMPAPTIFHEFMGNILEKVFSKRLKEPFYDSFRKSVFIHEALVQVMVNHESVWWKDESSKNQYKEWILEAWNTSVKNLEKSLGPKPLLWKWGRVHTVTHKHALGKSKLLSWLVDLGPIAANGSTEVINNFNFYMSPGLHEVHAGPSTRRVIDFVNPGESWGINPTGQCGYFANSHYRDQVSLYHQGEYRTQILERKALKEPKRLVFKAAEGSK